MHFSKLFVSTALLASAHVNAATLTAIPSPMQQGGMIHADVVFLDQSTDTFEVTLHHGSPEMKPLSIWSPGNDFDPSDPWYSELDPSQHAKPFNSQYGLLIDTTFSDPLPVGKSLGIRVLSMDAGLTGYFYRGTDGSEEFSALLGEAGDAVLWSGAMWHPVFVADAPGIYMTTLEFFVADETLSGFVEPTTALNDPGYSTGTVTLMLTAVPEPHTYALLAGAVCLGWVAYRRKR